MALSHLLGLGRGGEARARAGAEEEEEMDPRDGDGAAEEGDEGEPREDDGSEPTDDAGDDAARKRKGKKARKAKRTDDLGDESEDDDGEEDAADGDDEDGDDEDDADYDEEGDDESDEAELRARSPKAKALGAAHRRGADRVRAILRFGMQTDRLADAMAIALDPKNRMSRGEAIGFLRKLPRGARGAASIGERMRGAATPVLSGAAPRGMSRQAAVDAGWEKVMAEVGR
ncbi:MAG: hypothetical protein KGN77_01790 [Xanthomonadaceae bacterium]|nr:hypothetical protein [Xanthomonadaceae bacterium]